MLQKQNHSKLRTWVVLGLTLCFLLVSARQAPAQLFSTFIEINGMIEADSTLNDIGESVQFNVNMDAFLFLNFRIENFLWVEWDFGDGTVIRTSEVRSTVFHEYRSSGHFEVQLRMATPQVLYIATTDVSIRQRTNSRSIINNNSSNMLIVQFDANRNDRVDDLEFFSLVEAWIDGRVTDVTLFAAIDLWIKKSLISAANFAITTSSQETFRPLASSSSRSTTFQALGGEYDHIAVEIYSASGEKVFSGKAAGNQLRWNLTREESDAPLANGVYFYVLEATRSDGALVRSMPIPIQILR